MGKWKGIRSTGGKSMELYNLEKDPRETRNVASEHPEIVSKIKHIMNNAATPSEDYPIRTKEFES
jgi:hypothetical protein